VIAGLDSSISRPSAAQAAAMRARGVRVYGVYLPPGQGLAAPWDRAAVQVLQDAGLRVIGFASGNDDPAQLMTTAATWGVRGCLDDEAGIRIGSGWQQAWLNASGFGVYGNEPVHGVRAAFHVAALYPGLDPGATWPPGWARPPGPLGWQWQGTHTDPSGVVVDSAWYDDWFGRGGGQPMQQITCLRPDGGTDTYTIIDGVLWHAYRTGLGELGNPGLNPLPGAWSALIAAGYRGLEPFVQGHGIDVGHSTCEITDPGPGWTEPVPKP